MEILETISQNLFNAKLYTLISLYTLVLGVLIKDHERTVRFFHIFKNALLFAVWAILMLIGLDKLGIYELNLHTIHFIFFLSVLLSLPFLYKKMSAILSGFFKKIITNAIVRALFFLTLMFLLLSPFFKTDFIEKYYFLIFYTLVPLHFLSSVFSTPDEDDSDYDDDDDNDDFKNKTISELLFPPIKRRSNPKK